MLAQALQDAVDLVDRQPGLRSQPVGVAGRPSRAKVSITLRCWAGSPSSRAL